MELTYRLNANELNEDFLKSVKALFKTKRISIFVEEEMDETDYLLSTEANRKHLEAAIKSNDGYEFSSIEELKKFSIATKKK